MSNVGYITTRLLGLPADTRKVLTEVFDYLVPNLRFGAPDTPKSENFSAFYASSTTPSTANTEFSIAHGMARTPYLAIQVLDLNAVGAQIVPLTNSRAADQMRVYLKSTSTSAVITLLLE